MDILNSLSGLIGQPMNKPVIPGTNIRVPRWLDPRRIYQNPARILDPTGVRGGALTGIGIGMLGEALGVPEKVTSPIEIGVTTPGPLPLKLGAYLVANELINPRPAGGAIYDENGYLTPSARRAREIALSQGRPDPFGVKDRPVDQPTTSVQSTPTVKPPVPVQPPAEPEETYIRETDQERGSTAALPGRSQELSSPKPQVKPMNELAKAYLDTEIKGKELEGTGELQRRLFEGGALGQGASFDDVMAWTEANPGLAYRVASQKGLL